MPRSPSPVPYKRRRYDADDDAGSVSSRTSDHHQSSRRNYDSSTAGSSSRHRDRDHRDRSDRYDRDRDRERDRDRDGDRRTSRRDDHRSSSHRSSRDYARDGDRDRDRDRRYYDDQDRRGSSRRSGADYDHDRSSRHRTRSVSPVARQEASGDGPVKFVPPPKQREHTPPQLQSKPKGSFVSSFANAPSAPAPSKQPAPAAAAPAPADEDEKLRLKRERLEAWKAKKAAEAAKAAAPAPPLTKPAPSTPATATTSNGNKTSTPPKLRSPKIGGLPSKPASNGQTKFTPAAGPTSLPAAPASLPAKPTFTFVNNTAPSKPTGLRKNIKLEDEVETTKIGMIQFDNNEEIDMNVEHDAQEDADDTEDLEGGVVYQARERAREAREIQERDEAAAAASQDHMQVDQESKPDDADQTMNDGNDANAGAKDDKEDEVDELDAYMSGVIAEVKSVNKADRQRDNKRSTLAMPVTQLEGVDDLDDEEPVSDGDDLDKADSAADILALAAKKVRRGRDLPAVDHSKVNYEPFRKAFYHEPPEVAALTPEQVEELRVEMDGIKVRGTDPPKPVSKWSYCGLPAVVNDVIKDLGFTAPTAIQAQAIPAIMSGRDMIGVAKTGSGKTIAFLLPMFRHIKDQRPLRTMEGPIGMIMTPTRELATQIHRECKPFLKALGLRATCAYGGMPLKDNIADVKRGAEIMVCTPGRMIELLTTNSGRVINLHRVTYLVLDEADRMFDMGFEPQVMKIIGQIRPDRQTVLFSATFPRQMEALARKILRKPLEIVVGGRSVVAPEIEQIVEVREENTKFNRTLELLGKLFSETQDARAIIFVERQESADKLLTELLRKNYTCMSLHGGIEQVDRDQTISDFKKGLVPIVIATSVAARGLDIKQLKLVIQYDAPNHMEDYVHRAGRTGRAGEKGTCVTFLTPDQDRYALDLYRALVASKANVPDQVKTMAESFAEKVKEGKEKASSSGFGGKGLERLENERDALSRAERAAYGEPVAEKSTTIIGEDGEPIESTGGGGAGGKPGTSDVLGSSGGEGAPGDFEVEIRRGPAPDTNKAGSLSDAVQLAQIKAAEAAAIAQGKPAGIAKAQALMANYNALLKAKVAANKASHTVDLSTEAARRRDPDATEFHAIIWINDYPQKARWKVTNKETMVKLVDSTGASITNKGIFYEQGKDPGPEDPPKLHLLVESNDEYRVKQAVAEIKRVLIEGTAMALEAEQRPIGRYNVL